MQNYPNAFISTQNGSTKNRLKLYSNNQLWLNDGNEYQIEFENYTQRTLLAKIKIDGKFISDSGLILKPGQHIYLDRYFDSPRRFKFSTYQFENTPEAQAAIQNNGWVEIYFYEQYVNYNSITFTNHLGWNYDNRITGSMRTGDANSLYGAGRYDNSRGMMSVNCCNNVEDDLNCFHGKSSKDTELKETGRTQEGSISNQSFKFEDFEFNAWHSHHVVYKLVPYSAIIDKTSVRNYCSHCSYRVRDSKWIYCPKCGNRV